MPRLAKHLPAHRDRPEARAQGDKTLPILVGKFHYRALTGRFFCQHPLPRPYIHVCPPSTVFNRTVELGPAAPPGEDEAPPIAQPTSLETKSRLEIFLKF